MNVFPWIQRTWDLVCLGHWWEGFVWGLGVGVVLTLTITLLSRDRK